MILGTFLWRDMEIEVDIIANETVGEAIWLNRIDTGSATGFGIIRGGRLFPMPFTPTDDLAVMDLRAAYDDFRASREPA